MLANFRKFVSGAGLPKHPKKHHKPFRIRHLSLFIIGICLIILSAFGIGFVLGRSASTDIFIPPPQATPDSTSEREVKSSLGFQFKYDPALFAVEGYLLGSESRLSGESLSNAAKLEKVLVKPQPNYVDSEASLSELTIDTEENGDAFDSFKNTYNYQDDSEALEAYYMPQDDENFNYEKLSSKEASIDKKKFLKITYKLAPKFGSDSKPVYQVHWLGINQKRPLKIQVTGLLNQHVIPGVYDQIFDTLKFGIVISPQVEPLALGLFENKSEEPIEENFDINIVSPAVVKIYHFICGRLVLQGKTYDDGMCDVSIGSGFLISSDGVIATNGHVVVKDAADILVGEFLRNPNLLAQFAHSEGLTPEQASRSDVIASLLAKIYDLPADRLRLENKQELILAALGDKPVVIESQEDIRTLKISSDDDFVKKAQVIDVDYEAKDLLTIEQGGELGFSASDVALLKIDITQAPFIALADSSKLQQNDNISLIGFPSDAENKLISNKSLAPSVTNGTIGSIRKAKGSDSRLFQTDADASQGSSGGPAIDENGQAFGILTYRFKDGTQSNAAKSYIRDIADLKELIDTNDISIDTESVTQKQWEEGLRLFNQSRYSAALSKFEAVYRNYPAHRLVNTYAAQAQQAIREDRDIKDTNYSLVGLIYGGIAGLVGIILGAALLAHHHRQHKAYKEIHSDKI